MHYDYFSHACKAGETTIPQRQQMKREKNQSRNSNLNQLDIKIAHEIFK